jgi:sugar O-acyltransferase (sialic acid O-acetyltransferase NeuD family)
MKQVVVFGDGQVAGLAQFFLSHDSPYEPVAFTVDRAFLKSDTLMGLPVVPFEEVLARYPVDEFGMFIAVGYSRLNRFREEKYHQAKDMGYQLISYVSSRATTWPGANIGDNCFIMDNNVIQPFATVGNNVTLWSGCHIGHESVIKDHCFLSAGTIISGNVTVESNCFFGVNSTIRDVITIAHECVIGAGALIMKSTQAKGVYLGPTAQLLPMPSDRLPNL